MTVYYMDSYFQGSSTFALILQKLILFNKASHNLRKPAVYIRKRKVADQLHQLNARLVLLLIVKSLMAQ